ncbi:hypothetical protein P7K49_036997 [Saguinus oedipus]|uniref:Piezo TM1-24 domain-containing protein n=1 Tax=Saguinus oedipus TaxID=9490 RepID=A0ABQ9TLQ7_SAGOE|nr:hypothetical protein P7K49_036997 [Saguinus oedipus]
MGSWKQDKAAGQPDGAATSCQAQVRRERDEARQGPLPGSQQVAEMPGRPQSLSTMRTDTTSCSLSAPGRQLRTPLVNRQPGPTPPTTPTTASQGHSRGLSLHPTAAPVGKVLPPCQKSDPREAWGVGLACLPAGVLSPCLVCVSDLGLWPGWGLLPIPSPVSPACSAAGHTGRLLRALLGLSLLFLAAHLTLQICLHTVPHLDQLLGPSCESPRVLDLKDVPNAIRLVAPDLGIFVVSSICLGLCGRLARNARQSARTQELKGRPPPAHAWTGKEGCRPPEPRA